MEFDASGTFVAAWGGPDSVPAVGNVSQWPEGVEGIAVDGENNIWVFGYKANDHAVLKFARDGTLLLRIGERGVPGDDTSHTHLNRPTTAYHDIKAREVFISDGYGNHRVVAFNSDTGEFTRMWGAYGKDPATLSAADGFGNPVHRVALGPDGMIYVADRMKNRVQAFERIAGGARFLREVAIAPGTQLFGSAFDLAFSPCGRFMYVADGSNNRVWIVGMENFCGTRLDGQLLRRGRQRKPAGLCRIDPPFPARSRWKYHSRSASRRTSAFGISGGLVTAPGGLSLRIKRTCRRLGKRSAAKMSAKIIRRQKQGRNRMNTRFREGACSDHHGAGDGLCCAGFRAGSGWRFRQ